MRGMLPLATHPPCRHQPQVKGWICSTDIHVVVPGVEDLYGQCFHLLTGPSNIKKMHICIYLGRYVAVYRYLPPHTSVRLGTHWHAVCLSVCVSLFINRQRFRGWSNSWALPAPSELFWLYHAANAGMCNTGCRSWQAKQFLFGSGYFTVICLWYNMPFCLVLRHHLLSLCWGFFSVHLFWILLSWICQHESWEIHPHFK